MEEERDSRENVQIFFFLCFSTKEQCSVGPIYPLNQMLLYTIKKSSVL